MKFFRKKGFLFKLIVTLCIGLVCISFCSNYKVQAKHYDSGNKATGTYQEHGGKDATKTKEGQADGKTTVYKDGCYVKDGKTYQEDGTPYSGEGSNNGYAAGTQSPDYEGTTSSSSGSKHSPVMQGGKLLTPIFDLLMTIGDGCIWLLQKAVMGTESSVTLDFGLELISVIIGIIAAIAAVVLIVVLTAGIGAVVMGIGTAIAGATGAAILTAIGSSGIVTFILTGTMLAGALAGYKFATTAFSAAVLPDITVFPTYSISPEEMFEGRILLFDIDFFNPKEVRVKLENGTSKLKKDYNENTDGDVEYYYYEDSGKEVITSKQSTAAELSSIISKWYYSIRNIAVIVMMLILIYIGIRIMISSVASEKSKYKKMLGDWVISMCLVFVLHYIMVFAVSMNQKIVSIVEKSTDKNQYVIVLSEVNNKDRFVKVVEKNEDLKLGLVDSAGINLYNDDGSSNSSAGEATAFIWPTNLMGQLRMMAQMQDGTVGYIGYSIAFIVLVFYTIFFAVTYLKRVLYMAFLTIIAPLVAMTYSLDKIADGKAQAFNMWLKEYIGNLLIQPVHLLLYMVLISMSFDLASQNIIYTLVAMGFMMPAEKLIRTMFGLDKAKTPGFLGGATGAALAMSALKGFDKFAGKGPGGNKKPKFAENPKTDPKGIYDRSADSGKNFTELLGNGDDNPIGNEDLDLKDKNSLVDYSNNDKENKLLDNEANKEDNLTDYSDIDLEEKNANKMDFLDKEEKDEYNRLNNLSGDDKYDIRNLSRKKELEEKANNAKDEHFNKERENRRLLEESKRRKEEQAKKEAETQAKKISQSRLEASKRYAGNKFKSAISKDNMKNMISTTAENGARLTGAAVGAGIGVAAGVASGDLQSVVKNAGLGASVGDSIGTGVVNRAAVASGKFDEGKIEYEKERYGSDYSKVKKAQQDAKFKNDREARKKFETSFEEQLSGLSGREREKKIDKFMDVANKYREYGVPDNDLIIKAMKLDKGGNMTSKDSIASAMMASRGKDMNGIDKYERQLAKQVGSKKAAEIAKNARKIGGVY